MQKSALGRGLGSLIQPQSKPTITEQVIPEAEDKQELLEIEPGQIVANPRQPRLDFKEEDLEDLVRSIKEHGIMQPLVVTKKGAGTYELIAGERRLRASKLAGLEKVPAIVREADDQLKLELALIENIQRSQLNAVEEALAYKALIEEFALTQEQAAQRVGKSRSAVANIVRLLDLPDDMLQAVRDGKLSKSHARTLLAQTDPVKRQDLFEQMLSGGVSVREAEAKVQSDPNTKTKASSKDPNVLALEKKLREIVGTKVTISEKKGKGKVSIDFYSKQELLDLIDRMMDM